MFGKGKGGDGADKEEAARKALEVRAFTHRNSSALALGAAAAAAFPGAPWLLGGTCSSRAHGALSEPAAAALPPLRRPPLPYAAHHSPRACVSP